MSPQPLTSARADLSQCSGMTPEPKAEDETANKREYSPADGIEGGHRGQHECQDDQGCAALPVAVSLSEHNPGAADQKRGGEENSAEVREPKALTEPSPIASDSSHARMLGQGNERHPWPAFGMTPENASTGAW
jgi:hypothetical protein